MNIHYRLIESRDNQKLASVIRKALDDYGINSPGTVYTDPTTDTLFELFRKDKSIYWIAEYNDEIIGGCGIYPTPGLPEGCGELVKLYLNKDFRGKGIGKELMQKSILSAKELGYTSLYLESLPQLNDAIHLYKKVGFKEIDHRLGESGHFACNLWMTIKI